MIELDDTRQHFVTAPTILASALFRDARHINWIY